MFLWALLAGPHHREHKPVCSVAPVPLTVTLLETDMRGDNNSPLHKPPDVLILKCKSKVAHYTQVWQPRPHNPVETEREGENLSHLNPKDIVAFPKTGPCLYALLVARACKVACVPHTTKIVPPRCQLAQ